MKLDTSNDPTERQFVNISLIFLTLSVLNVVKSIDVKYIQFKNISDISVTKSVLNVSFNFNSFNAKQFENIPFILITLDVSNLDKFRNDI